MVALVIENPLSNTGVGRYSRYLIEFLEKNVIHYEIIDFTNSLNSRKVVKKGYGLKWFYYFAVWCGQREVLVLGDYKLLLFPTATPLSVLVRGNKIVAIHDLMHRFYNFNEVARLDIRLYRESLYKSIARSNISIVLDSVVGAEHFARFYGDSNKKFIIPFYANLQKLDYPRSDLVSEKGLENYLFYPAAFWAHKNHLNLVLGVKELVSRTNISFKVVFCGKPNDYMKRICNLITDLNLENYFLILDFVDDNELIELYRNSKGLIFPSYFGPTNIPPLEAISLGVPIGVADVFNPKLIYGEGILTFNPNSIQDIAEACRLLLCSENIYMGNTKGNKEKFEELWLEVLNEN